MAQSRLVAIKAAVEDGRAANVYYKQTQLEKLHKNLISSAGDLQAAISASTGVSASEAKEEYGLALHALRDRYAEIDPKKELQDEYSIAHGNDSKNARTAVGAVVIQTSTHTPLFSIIAPLSAAIAGGNVAVVQLDASLGRAKDTIQNVLEASLDPDSFVVTPEPVPERVFGKAAVYVNQNGDDSARPRSNELLSVSKRPVVAIVDRSANFEEAAKALVDARFGFRGRSPYAPDLVLVNEFSKKDLLQALVRQTIAIGEQTHNVGSEKASLRLAGIQKGGNARIVTESSSGTVVERSQDKLPSKINEPLLVVQSMSSLDDAIDYISSNTSSPLLAAYHFGSPASAKYLTQFIASDLTFVNHIPHNLLVGPAFPSGHSIDPSTRYPTSLFTRSAPAFIQRSSTAKTLAKAGLTSSTADRQAAIQKLYVEAISKLPVIRKRQKQLTVSFGFFEHAFVLHFGTHFFTTLGLLGAGGWWLRKAWLARQGG